MYASTRARRNHTRRARRRVGVTLAAVCVLLPFAGTASATHEPSHQAPGVAEGRTTPQERVAIRYTAVCDYASGTSTVEVQNQGEANDVELVVWGRDAAVEARDLDVGRTFKTTFPYAEPGARFGYYVKRPQPATGVIRATWQCPIEPTFATPDNGYWMASNLGVVTGFGRAGDHAGNDASVGLSGTRDFETTPDNGGHWLVNGFGAVRAVGTAGNFGSAERMLQFTESTRSISRTPSGKGYWLFTDRGRVLPFGDAAKHGEVTTPLAAPVVDSVATPSGNGYYLVAADGGVFTYGDATFRGSTGNLRLNAPVRSLVPDPDGVGYWLVASDGGVFAFDAPFRGSLGGTRLNKPVIGMVAYGDGYLMVGEDGGIFTFSTKPFYGSFGFDPFAGPIVAVAAFNTKS